MDILLACLPALPSAVASPFLPVLAPLIRRCGAAAALLLQEDFKGVVGKAQGFAYRPERPERATFVEQKWGWSGDAPGACRLQLDALEGVQ